MIQFDINQLFVQSKIVSSIWLNSSIQPLHETLTDLFDEILTGTNTPGQSGSQSNSNEGVIHKAPELKPHHQMVKGHMTDTHGRGVLPLHRETVDMFSS